MKIKPYTNQDLMSLAMQGQRFEITRILATYASPENWKKGIDEKNGCTWIWNGPVICAYELASWGIVETLKQDKEKVADFGPIPPKGYSVNPETREGRGK